MGNGPGASSRPRRRSRTRMVTAVLAAIIGGCAASGAVAPAIAADATVWLCRPGMATTNFCETDRAGVPWDLDTTVVPSAGPLSERAFTPAADPKVDCFYVYPTVDARYNSKREPRNEVIGVTLAQAVAFRSVCRLFVPIYRQLSPTGPLTVAAQRLAYTDVATAWKEYLANDNDGRGVILLGHSQGTGVLTELIQKEVDGDPAARARIVSALLIGGTVLVPNGKDVGGSFQQMPACRVQTQTGCVVAYHTSRGRPSPFMLFGRSSTPGQQMLCVNPAALAGGAATMDSMMPTRHLTLPALNLVMSSLGRVALPRYASGFASYPGLVRGRCERRGAVTALGVTAAAGDPRPRLPSGGFSFVGLHVLDYNIALADLLRLTAAQADAYVSRG